MSLDPLVISGHLQPQNPMSSFFQRVGASQWWHPTEDFQGAQYHSEIAQKYLLDMLGHWLRREFSAGIPHMPTIQEGTERVKRAQAMREKDREGVSLAAASERMQGLGNMDSGICLFGEDENY